jgi:hypothetical protein
MTEPYRYPRIQIRIELSSQISIQLRIEGRIGCGVLLSQSASFVGTF